MQQSWSRYMPTSIWGGNLPDVEILTGLFYDGKPLTLYDEGDDYFLYAQNLIARFSIHSNDKYIMVGDGFWVDYKS